MLDRGECEGVEAQLRVVMGVRVDEPGRDDAAGGVDHVAGVTGATAGIGRFYSIAAEKNDLSGYLHASRRLMGYATAAVVNHAGWVAACQ